MQVYWCYTDQRYGIYLQTKSIDNLLIEGVNFVLVSFVSPISLISILNG